MYSLPVLLTLALAAFVSAQGHEHDAEIDAIEAHFAQSRIVPELLKDFDPEALLTLDYGSGPVTPGQKFAKEAVGPTPTVTVTPGDDDFKLDGTYTLAMVDADVVGGDISKGVTRHWLVNGVKVGQDGKVTTEGANAITAYAGPWPAAGSGPHRYVVALYEQPEGFAAPEGFTETLPVGVFDWNKYVADSKLGALVAANYITVEEGTATGNIPATSAVVSSTLAASSTASGRATGSTAAPGANNTAPANTENGALSLKSVSPLAALVAGCVVLAL